MVTLEQLYRNNARMKKFLIYLIALLFLQITVAQNKHMNLTGDAKEVNGSFGSVGLVSGPNQTGGAWYPQSLNLDSSFQFDVFIELGNLGAEGLAFVLHSDSISIGSGAELLGVPSTGKSFVFEFDLQQNGSTTDAVAPHTSFFKNGSLLHQSADLLQDVVLAPNLFNTESVRIEWNPITQTFTVYRLGCTNSDLYYTGDIKNTIFGGDSRVFFGYTAATSAVNDTINIFFQRNSEGLSEDKTICQGNEVKLHSYNGGPKSWSSKEPYSELSIFKEEIIAQPSATTYYKVRHEVPCGVFEDSILVTVIDTAIINTEVIHDPNSNYADVILNITGGVAPVSHYWTLPDGNVSYEQDLISIWPGTYTVLVSSGKQQCEVQQTITVEPTSISQEDYFSPNGDGESEAIEITAEGESEIVNSAGQIIKVVNKGDFWDGTDKYGVLLPSGVYIVIGDSGKQTITLIR